MSPARKKAAPEKSKNRRHTTAEEFFADTVGLDMSMQLRRFTSRLPKKACILDFGCGSGRDTRWLLEHGYSVEATDDSERMAELASEYTGIQVRCMGYTELDAVRKYDGIWACASLQDIDQDTLPAVIRKMLDAIKPGGVIYTSFKAAPGGRTSRPGTDMSEFLFAGYFDQYDDVKTIEVWKTKDAREERRDTVWINLLVTKKPGK